MGFLFVKRFVLAFVLGIFVSGLFPPSAGCPEKLTIAYIGDEIGRLEPCG
jgi:hypothetical protein